jgi:Alpha-galactosidase
LIDSLKKEFPNVFFETCSSGGGRVDLGMFNRMDVAWASDNIDPLDRIYIQYGYLSAYPANTMVSWTGQESWHGLNYGMDFRFDVAMSGVLGIGNNITKWTEDEKKLAKEKIALYKEIRPMVHNGDLYRLSSPFYSNMSVLEYVSKDLKEAVVFCYKVGESIEGSTRCLVERPRLVLKGLDQNKTYEVEGTKYTGLYLMNTGIANPVKGICKSKVIKIIQCD